RWLLATTGKELLKPDRHFPERTKIRREKIARLDRQRCVAGAGGDDAARFERDAKLAQFVGEPRQGQSGIAEHILSVTDELLSAQRDDRPFLDEIERAPVRGRCRTEHEPLRAGIVSTNLRGAGPDEFGN